MPYPNRHPEHAEPPQHTVSAYHNPSQHAPMPQRGATPSYVPPPRPGDIDLSTIPPIPLPPGVDPIWVIVDALEELGEHWRQQRPVTRLKLAQFALLLVQIAGMNAAQNMSMLAKIKREQANAAQRAAQDAADAEQAARDLEDADRMLRNGGTAP